MERILVVDDEKNYLVVLDALLSEAGYQVETAGNGQQALRALTEGDEPALLLTDMRMPGLGGLDLIPRVKDIYPELPVVVMTAYGTVENAVEAMKSGVVDYLSKPFQNQNLLLTVERALRLGRLLRQNRLLREEVERHGFDQIVGEGSAMREIYELMEKVAPTKTTVLITGESGTGKELVARAIHARSPRREEAFVAVNCMALSETLLESELFGHEKGSFTGAVERRKGRFELADRGTLFLDEVGELSVSLQVKLLRVLQERAFERVGGNQTIQVDVRIIAATNRDLAQAVAENRFREDLYYRLNVMHLRLPPLRERRDDLSALVVHFVAKYAKEMGRTPPAVSPEVLPVIYEHNWPGNVRELENALERAVLLADQVILPKHLPLETRNKAEIPMTGELPRGLTLNQALDDLELRMIRRALEQAEGVAAHAADLLGLPKANLAYKMKKYGLK